MNRAVGIDLGRSPALALLVDISGRIIEEYTFPLEAGADFEVVLNGIGEALGKFSRHGVAGIGIGVPGTQDTARGVCLFSPNFPSWVNVPIAGMVRERFKLPVSILNDVNAAALGEKYFGIAGIRMKDTTSPIYMEEAPVSVVSEGIGHPREVRNLVFIAMGVGIGSGLIINNELVSGAHGAAGEIGHISLRPDGPRCHCGNQGCFEAYASLWAIRRDIGISPDYESSILKVMVDSPSEIGFKELRKALAHKDPLVQGLIKKVARFLGQALAVIVNLVDPELLVIGGETAPLLENYIPIVREELESQVRLQHAGEIKIITSRLKERAGACGAAARVMKSLMNL
ncbi:MAG: ROK family protein [Candidatus Eremiobacteraeota bacterium]|nr:ROK family protein [Candidatus Eremiobacteraeota bacterium]